LKKILVIQTASIGDVILATPVAEKLHAFYPDAAIDLLVKKGNESLFDGHPFLHEILVWNKRQRKIAGLLDIGLRIRKTKYDLVVNIQRFGSTGMLTAFSGAKMTIGFDKNPFSFLFTKKIRHLIGSGIHEVQRNLELIKELTDGAFMGPKLYPAPVSSHATAGTGGGTIYTISPASLWFTKQFPVEKWIEFLKMIPHDAKVYLLGSRSDTAFCDEIISRGGHPGAVNLAGQLSFLDSAALMKQAKMNYTNDSAPMHLASSVDAPVTVLYCSTIPAFGFGPLSKDSAVAETDEPLPCRPCGLHGLNACPEKHFRCALTIPVNKLTARL
jgi:ADP-heptose:LPS heptosyltransferase